MLAVCGLAACSTNPATGEQQFAALMSPQQENNIGAQENAKVMQSFGVPDGSQALQTYLQKIGQSIAANTERPEVQYKFTLIDSPTVNAFAVPGGYIYVTRGLMALANSEAELAGVLAHEVGHITGRHSAERYSHGVLTSLGAIALSTALDSGTASQAIGLGSELYITSYSRKQEHEADDLGIRYLHRAGYDTFAMAQFLESLDRWTALDTPEQGFNYFSTHPRTEDRAVQALAVAGQYPKNQATQGHDDYLRAIDGLVYGDSAKHGFARGQAFWHPQIGFTFTVPDGFEIDNQPSQVAAVSKSSGGVILFDAVQNAQRLDPVAYLSQVWLKGEPLPGKVERIDINGMPAATTDFPGRMGSRPVTVRLVAVQWSSDTVFRFQMGIPQGAGAAFVEDLKRTTYSLRAMSAAEKQSVKPYRLRIVAAGAGDNIAALSSRMPFGRMNEERFRVLNGLKNGNGLTPGQAYKIVGE